MKLMDTQNIIEMLHITKEFPGIIANDDIALQLRHGEIHALLGENGAGKSTLMKVLSGVYTRDSGEVKIFGKPQGDLTPKLAQELGVTFYLAMGVDACLAIYPQSTWDRFTEKFSSLPMSQSKAMRPLFANAAKCELDSQGRIVIPQKLRRYSGLDKDVVILGVNDRAEIWSADAWQAQEEEEMTPEKMSACMEALGF